MKFSKRSVMVATVLLLLSSALAEAKVFVTKEMMADPEFQARSMYRDCDFSKLSEIPDGFFASKQLIEVDLPPIDLTNSGINQTTTIRFCHFRGSQFSNGSLSGTYFHGVNFENMDLTDSGIERNSSFNYVTFKSSKLPSGIFSGQNLKGVKIENVDLTHSGIETATQLEEAKITASKLPRGALSGKNLNVVEFKNMDLKDSGIESASNLTNVKLREVQLPPRALAGMNIDFANFEQMDLTDSGIEDAAQRRFVTCIQSGFRKDFLQNSGRSFIFLELMNPRSSLVFDGIQMGPLDLVRLAKFKKEFTEVFKHLQSKRIKVSSSGGAGSMSLESSSSFPVESSDCVSLSGQGNDCLARTASDAMILIFNHLDYQGRLNLMKVSKKPYLDGHSDKLWRNYESLFYPVELEKADRNRDARILFNQWADEYRLAEHPYFKLKSAMSTQSPSEIQSSLAHAGEKRKRTDTGLE